MPEPVACPHCGDTTSQVRTGLHGGSPRYKCKFCQRKYVPLSLSRDRAHDLQIQAMQLRMAGQSLREIGERLSVHPRTIARWLTQSAPEPPVSRPPAPTPFSSPTTEPQSKRRATVDDVAKLAGVSISTVSNAINNAGRMSERTKARVREAMDILNFAPNALIRGLRRGRTGILGVFCFGLSNLDSDMGERIAIPLLSGIYDEAWRRDRNILMFTGWEDHWTRSTWRPFLDGNIDGLIWMSPGMSDTSLERLASAGLPVVALLSRHVPEGVGYVNADNLGGVEMAVEHLHSVGHRRIGFVGPVFNSNYFDRQEGFRRGLAAVGLAFDPALESTSTPEDWVNESHLNQVLAWLKLPDPPTAIVMLDDQRAMKLVRELSAAGVRVPDDIAVTGFDDLPDAALCAGGLTTIRQEFREIGSRGVDRLIALIDGAPTDQCRITVPTTLVVRRSTAGGC